MENKKKRINITILPKDHNRLKELARAGSTDVSKLVAELVQEASRTKEKEGHAWIWTLGVDTLERIEQYAYEHHTTPEQAVTDWAFGEKPVRKTRRGQTAKSKRNTDPAKSNRPIKRETSPGPDVTASPALKEKMDQGPSEKLPNTVSKQPNEELPIGQDTDASRCKDIQEVVPEEDGLPSTPPKACEEPKSYPVSNLSQYDFFLKGEM